MFSLRMAKILPILGMIPSKSLGVFVNTVFKRLGVLAEFCLLAGGVSVSAHVICVKLTPLPGD